MVKRTFDCVFGLLGLVLFFSLFTLIAILIKIDSPGPVFYRGWRTGRFGKLFRIYKFRTMVVDAERRGGPSTALNDPRLTKIGKFLRKYKLDELPQLINILFGEMSFVGPRPQIEGYTKLYTDEEKIILMVRPGLTDYASIKFIHLDKILGDERIDEKYLKEIEPEKNKLRVMYAKEHSLWIDFKILIQTFLQLFKIRTLWNTKNLG
jgi:lipopolysaccharide/colanic/teichoic acid biosynthesis glycosyltransferase